MRTGNSTYAPTSAAAIVVFIDKSAIDRPYDVVGFVSAQKTAGWTFTNVSEQDLIDDLKSKASELGANAIVLESMQNDSVPWAVQGAGGSSSLDRKAARAIAIRFRN